MEMTGQQQQYQQLPDDELNKLIRERELALIRRKRISQYKYYVPNGKAERFIGMVGGGKYFINLFIAANGVGKTAVEANILANICFPNNKEWFDYPLYNSWPYLRKGRIISDTTTVTKTIVPELHKWFPQGKYTSTKADKHYESIFTTKGEGKPPFEFDIMTYEQDLKQFESATLGFIIFDEPPPEMIWKASISRLRRGGIIICCFTPLAGSAFFYDTYVTAGDVIRY